MAAHMQRVDLEGVEACAPSVWCPPEASGCAPTLPGEAWTREGKADVFSVHRKLGSVIQHIYLDFY